MYRSFNVGLVWILLKHTGAQGQQGLQRTAKTLALNLTLMFVVLEILLALYFENPNPILNPCDLCDSV